MESHFWVRNGVVLMNMLNYTTTVNRRNSCLELQQALETERRHDVGFYSDDASLLDDHT